MALPTSFANATTATGQQLDNNFQAVGALVTVQCTAIGTNAITLTPAANAPAVTAYNLPYPVKFGFVGFTTSTGSVTLQVGSLASLPVYTPTGAQAAGGDIVAGFYYEVAFVVASTYNSGNGAWVITNPLPLAGSSPVDLGETRGLIIANNSGTPNTKIDISASRAVMVTTSGLPVFASGVAVTIDLTTTGANGMDTGSRPANGWVYLYLISTGLVTAGLASATSPTAGTPTMPTGYNYAAYVGAMVLSSSNLLRTRQLGNDAGYVVSGTSPPTIQSGSTSSTWTSESITGVVPLTAGEIHVLLRASYGDSGAIAAVAPNTSYGVVSGADLTAPYPPIAWTAGTGSSAQSKAFYASDYIVLQSTSIGYISSIAAAAIYCNGWRDYYSR